MVLRNHERTRTKHGWIKKLLEWLLSHKRRTFSSSSHLVFEGLAIAEAISVMVSITLHASCTRRLMDVDALADVPTPVRRGAPQHEVFLQEETLVLP